ncbi:MAG TPA: DUF72 domain-containing protein, partial [Thermoleophilia bacterium]|nr:DUF72 domain-containing protein [Thermoleophilia bacterium]
DDDGAGLILVGNCSWTDPTLVASGAFYPRGVTSAEDRLRFYATQFPIVEVDSTFYAPPQERHTRLWVERTPEGFVFDVKAFALLTTHGAPPERFPPELRGILPPEAQRKRNVYAKDLTPDGRDLLWELHRKALDPLRAAGKLGAVLFQFPPWFRAGRYGREYLEQVAEQMEPYPVAVEFRGGGWLDDERHTARTLGLLEELGLAYVAVDEPQGFASSSPAVAAATAPLAVIRFHGRNAETWDKRTNAASDRFNYLYAEDELREWLPRVRLMAEHAAAVHVLFNNNYQDYGIRNARQMAALLDAEEIGPRVEPAPPAGQEQIPL